MLSAYALNFLMQARITRLSRHHSGKLDCQVQIGQKCQIVFKNVKLFQKVLHKPKQIECLRF